MRTPLRTILSAILLLTTHVVFAQQTNDLIKVDTSHQVVVKEARYEIVQSTVGALATFKLDTHSGEVYQLTTHLNSGDTWERVNRISGSLHDIWYINRKNYTLFVSTLSMRYIYLLNIHTGATWQFAVDPKTKKNFFLPMVTNEY